MKVIEIKTTTTMRSTKTKTTTKRVIKDKNKNNKDSKDSEIIIQLPENKYVHIQQRLLNNANK